MLTFSASSSVVVECREASRQAGFEQVSSGCNGYISGVLFVDGGFCVGNELWGFQAASSCIEYMASVQGSGHGNGRWERGALATRRIHCQAHYLTLGTTRRSLKTDNTSSQDKSASRYPYSPMGCQPHVLNGTQRLFSAFPIIACVSARLHHLNLGCAAPIA